MAIENEDMIHSLSEAVIDDMGVVNHPIILDHTNICDLVRTGDLNQLKVSKLNEICLQGHLETPGQQNRRKTFVDPLVNYAKRCSCIFNCPIAFTKNVEGPEGEVRIKFASQCFYQFPAKNTRIPLQFVLDVNPIPSFYCFLG